MAKQRKITRPRDWAQRAFSVVQQAIGEAPKQTPPKKDPKAVKRGRLGGIRGASSRSKKLSHRRKAEIARRAARARWNT